MNLVKIRARYAGVTKEITLEGMINQLRKLIKGEAWMQGLDAKRLRQLKVWLLEHGIEVDKW